MFEWDDNYKVGIREIDEQHKKLFSLMRELHEAATVGKARTIVEKVLTGVVAYTKMHFGTEENLMRVHEYPDYLKHKRMHDELVKQANELLEKCKANALSISVEVLQFLNSWIAHHISETDKKLGKYLAARGVA